MIYVDAIKPCLPTEQWRFKSSCHLFCDPGDEEMLHRVASYIFLKRSWFQDRPDDLPHYDLTASRRKLALIHGAVEADPAKLVDVMRSYRARKKVENPLDNLTPVGRPSAP